jgi:hypothetical protein
MGKRVTGSFILILVAAYLTPVGADDLQETNYTGKTKIHSIATNLSTEF